MPQTLLFIQSGDYRDAYRRFEEGGEETYLEQRASVDFVARLATRMEVVVAAVSEVPYDEALTGSLRAIGIPEAVFYDPGVGRDLFARTAPDLAIPRVPQPGLLAALGEASVPSMPLFADIYQPARAERAPPDMARRWVRNRRMARLLRRLSPTAVGNHTFNASRSLVSVLGLPEERVVPWEWTPIEASEATRRQPAGQVRLLYAGVVSEVKGVGDLLAAVRHLVRDGMDVGLTVAGVGADLDRFAAETGASEIAGHVSFLGRVPHARIAALMREVHAVVVPSRHAYPEGLPNVIFETLAARTPLVASDHPAWIGRLTDGRDALIFREGDPGDLARQVARIAGDAELYAALSRNAAAALDSLYVGTSWYELVDLFVADPGNETGWLEGRTLAAMRRDRPQIFAEG